MLKILRVSQFRAEEEDCEAEQSLINKRLKPEEQAMTDSRWKDCMYGQKCKGTVVFIRESNGLTVILNCS